MSEVVIELGVVEPKDEAAFVQAIDRFARWREETCGQGWRGRNAPDLMIKTVCAWDGRLQKAITFQDQSWADTFLQFWQDERIEQAL